jgi:hypothetical protein
VRCASRTTVCRRRRRLRGCLARCCTGTRLAAATSAPALGPPAATRLRHGASIGLTAALATRRDGPLVVLPHGVVRCAKTTSSHGAHWQMLPSPGLDVGAGSAAEDAASSVALQVRAAESKAEAAEGAASEARLRGVPPA